MAKKQKKFEVYDCSDCDSKDKKPSMPVEPSDAKQLLESLLLSIDYENVENFKSLLTKDFIYPGSGLKEGDVDKSDKFYNQYLFHRYSYPGISYEFERLNTLNYYSNYKAVYRGNNHTRTIEYEYYYARPVIEAIFLEHNALFFQLLCHLAKSNNPELHKIFVECFESNNDLPKEIFSPCNDVLKEKLLKGVQDVQLYGKKLSDEGIDKGALVKDCATVLKKYVDLIPEEKNIYSAKVKSLDFKFKVALKLRDYAKNPVLGVHRGWKRIIGNIAAFVFTGPVLHIINFFATGNFLFFNNTETQNLIENVSKPLDVERKTLTT